MAKRQLRKRRTSKEKKVLVVNKNKKNKSKAGSKSATSAADTPQGDSPRRLELAAAHQELISDEAEQAKEAVVVVKEKEEGVNSHHPKKTTGPAAAAIDNGGFHLLRRSGKETVVVFARLSPPPPPPSPSVNSSPPPPPPPTSPATSSFYSPTSSPSPSFNSPLLLPTSPSPSPATSSFLSTSTPLPPSPSSKTAKPTEVVAQEEVDWEIVAIFDVSSKTAATGKSTAPRKKYLVGWKNSNNSSSLAVDYTASWVSENQLESGCKALLDLFNAHQQAFEEWKRNLFQLGFHCFQCALHRCHELVLKKLKEAGESLLAEQLKSLFSEAEPDWLSEKTMPAEKSKKAKPKPKMKMMKMKKEMMKKEKEKKKKKEEEKEKEEAKSQLLLKMKLLFAATKLADTLVAVNVKMKSEDPGDTTSDLVEGSDELYGVEDYRRLIGWQLKELQKLQ